MAGLSKPQRIRDPRAIRRCRKPYCEFCGVTGGRYEIHHIQFRSAGGHDIDYNLINLCVECHQAVHDKIVGAYRLLRIVAQREELEEEYLREVISNA